MNKLRDFKFKKMSPLFLVTDINRSIEFYIKELSFEVDFRYEDFYAGIIKDGYSIHLKMNKSSIKERKNEDINITFSIDNIEDFYEELKNKPVDVIQSLRDMPYGKQFYVADPDGNIIAFLE